MSLGNIFLSFLLYLPCIMLGAFFSYNLISWGCRKATVVNSAGLIWERIAFFCLLALTFLVMLIATLCISDKEFIVLWPQKLFYTCIIMGIPTLVITTFVILFRCIESWSECCSSRKRAQYGYLLFLTIWLFCFFVQVIVYIMLIKQIS
jgi:uncharacterized membrane protein YozB (DUF420 family)